MVAVEAERQERQEEEAQMVGATAARGLFAKVHLIVQRARADSVASRRTCRLRQIRSNRR